MPGGSMTRLHVARMLKVEVRKLRLWENCGLLPRFADAEPAVYADRVAILVSARRSMSMQRIRDALSIGGC